MLINNLEDLFMKKDFFSIDINTKEVDGLNGKIVLSKDSTLEEKIKAINLCAIVGFKSTALDLPIVKIVQDLNETTNNDILIKEVELDLPSTTDFNDKVSINLNRDLTNINSIENGLVIDTDEDLLPDEINAQVIIDEQCSDDEFIAACNIATLLGLNSLGCNIPVAFVENNMPNNDKINICIGNTFRNKQKDFINDNKEFTNVCFISNKDSYLNKDTLIISSEDDELKIISKCLCENYDYLIKKNETNLNELKANIINLLKPETQRKKISIFEKEYNFDWEVDEVKDIINGKLKDLIKPNDKVSIKVLVSEEKEIRDELEKFIENKVNEVNGNLEKCKVYCSYKQGLSWIMEDVIPNIKENEKLTNIEKIDIKFKPFLPEGKTKWSDEDGTIPNINASRDDNPDKYFDLPIRLVQELFPVDDLIEEEININRDSIEFKVLEDGNSDYEFVAYDSEGKIIYFDTFDVKYSERPYLNEFEGIGKVHPNTSLVEIKVNDKVVLQETIKTDVEKIWDVYQSEVLENCKKYILDITDGNPTVDKQPFFNTLKLDILTSEPDYKLNVRQDIISVLSALHEDIYFAGLDFFKTLGLRTCNQALDEPGLILPIINKRNNQGTYMKASLEVYENTVDYKLDVDVSINDIELKNGKVQKVYIELNGTNDDFKYIKENQSKIEEKIKKENYDVEKVVLRLNNEEIIITNNKNSCEDKVLKITDIDIPQDRVIGYDEYIEIMNKLKCVKGLNIFKASKSYQGRDIYAIELTKEYKSSIVSRVKLINNKPVFQINNRHHANEVSSTNSAFLLVEQLLENEEYRKYLDKVNVVMIPFENVDGGHIHYELQKDNPEWQFHIARFNSVGKEFARDYFNEDSKYTESRALTKLWNKWLPDILVDNHGVPKHEWDQQFSGYTSPWFKGFWLPRALFYGYFWYLDEENYPGNKILSEALQDVVSDYINADEEITKWNIDWQNRFEKYAHQWMPKLFPANYYKDLIYYWIPYKADKNAWHVSHRYPHITALDWTTEVSDETAQGEYLDLCSKTHNLADIATIEMMYRAKFDKREEVVKMDNEVVLKNIRIRPIQV